MEKGFGKEGDGARRHFRHTGIVILTKIAIPIRPKHGPFYDGTAALNNYGSCASGLGGAGWELADEIGVYCLNTALCSFGGIDDINGKAISDQNQLMIDTRSLYRWLEESSHTFRILVMHHPLDWLAPWAKTELQKIIQNSFKLVISGHVHENTAIFSSCGVGGSLNIVAPPLFTRKSGQLGYSFVTLDMAGGMAEVIYRQWSPAQKFVPGTGLAGNETGKLSFPFSANNYIALEVVAPVYHRNGFHGRVKTRDWTSLRRWHWL